MKRTTKLEACLLAAFLLLLFRCTGQQGYDVVFEWDEREQEDGGAGPDLSRGPIALQLQITEDSVFLGLLDAVYRQLPPPHALTQQVIIPKPTMRLSGFRVTIPLHDSPLLSMKAAPELAHVKLQGPINIGGLMVASGTLRQPEQFDLTLAVSGAHEPLAVVGYCQHSFERETIEQLLRSYERILSAIATNLTYCAREVPLLSEAEQERLLSEWNATLAGSPPDITLHHLFEEQAARTPDAVAVVFERSTLTYAELDQRANQLGHHLQELGVGPEVRVGIAVERSLEMVVGILGTLKAGGAYVPLDPTYPQGRLTFIIKDAAVAVLVTQTHLAAPFASHQVNIVCLDADWTTITQHNDGMLSTATTGTSLAYVIYMSGSTGEPKGVMVTHGNVVHLFEACAGSPAHSCVAIVLSDVRMRRGASTTTCAPTPTITISWSTRKWARPTLLMWCRDRP